MQLGCTLDFFGVLLFAPRYLFSQFAFVSYRLSKKALYIKVTYVFNEDEKSGADVVDVGFVS